MKWTTAISQNTVFEDAVRECAESVREALGPGPVLGCRRWVSVPPPPGLLDSALVAVAFWVGVDLFSGLLFPAVLGIALFFYLLGRRARLSSVKPAVAARSEARYKHLSLRHV